MVEAARAQGVQAVAVQAEVSQVAQIDSLFKAALDAFGKLDIVVANAGIEKVNIPAVDVTEEDFDVLFRVNTKGPYFVMRVAARHVADGGRIINVSYDFCIGRGAQYPIAFLGGTSEDGKERCWQGTLVRDEYAAYDSVLQAYPGRIAAGCLAHARRRYDELLRNQGGSTVAPEALRRIAQIYRLERELSTLSSEQRLARRHSDAKPLWEQLHAWLQLERSRVPDGGITAKALDYSLKNWPTLTHHLVDGEVSVDNNSLENLIRPWALGRRSWLFAGSELAGQRAAVVMSLVQSAKLQGHDPWAYLNDVLTRLPTHLNSRIDELLPHNWHPAR